MGRLRRFHFDVGDSTNGPIGFCAVIRVKSKKEALKLLKSALPENQTVRSCLEGDKRIEYIEVYFNHKKVGLDNCEDW